MKTLIAIILFKLGFKHYTSWSICEYLTYGYGKLSAIGHFEYEIPLKYIKNKKS